MSVSNRAVAITTPNREYIWFRALWHFAQVQSNDWTSDTHGTLVEIVLLHL